MHCFTSVVCVYFFKDKDIFDSKKKLKIMSANGLEHKLSSKQQEILEMNKGLFNLFSNQVCIFILLQLAYQIFSSKSKVQIIIPLRYCLQTLHIHSAGFIWL